MILPDLNLLIHAYNETSPSHDDSYLAALAVENQAQLHTLGSDFARFPDLCWVNPLTGESSSSDSSES